MNLRPQDKKSIDNFFDDIAAKRAGYSVTAFSYLAAKDGEKFKLVRGRIIFNTSSEALAFSHFESTNLRAGRYRLPELGIDERALLDQALAGRIDTSHGPLYFEPPPGGSFAATYIPILPDGLHSQVRISVLTIMAGQVENRSLPDLDWELKAASTPYENLQELVGEYAIGPTATGGNTATLEFVAINVAAIDSAKSNIAGDQATVTVLLASGLPREKFSLAYRVYKPGEPIIRTHVPASAFAWTIAQQHQSGVLKVKVPVAAVMNCVPVYDGVAQTHYWIGDPTRSQNPRRAVHEAFDPKLETVKDIIGKALRKGQEARDLESAVGWILWMLGFSVAQLGGIPRTQDAADLVAVSPAGHFAVIECTTGLLKADNKLPLLHDRAQAVRRALEASSHNQLRVLPIIVTTKTREEVRPDIDQAERLGILIVTRENLLQAVDQTIRMPTADQLYDQSFEAARTAQAEHDGIAPCVVELDGMSVAG
jgi:hypothetical protein